jgi:hypothetical protein
MRKQVILKQLIMHNWSDGEVQSTYPLGDYKSKFGTVSKFTGISTSSLTFAGL